MSLFTLPKEIEDIIYNNIHQMKMKNVMDELESQVSYCYRCRTDKVCIKNINNHTCSYKDEHTNCCNIICSHCYNKFMYYVNSMADNQDELDERPECMNCFFDDLQNDMEYDEISITSSEIDQVEEDIWQDMYGCGGDISQLY